MKPMLAGKLEDPHQLSFPVLASPKLDGIRTIIHNNQPVSRNLKPIPNLKVQEVLGGLPPMDGELIVGDPRAKDVFQRTSSGVMSRDGVPPFTYYVFDCLTRAPMGFNQRLELAKSYANSCGAWVQLVEHTLIRTVEGLLAYEEAMVAEGYEGIMIRDPMGPYKFGRSTTREGWLLKMKRFEDAEAEVIGFVEKEHNDNPLEQDALGRAKRSSHKANKRAADTLGALVVQDVATRTQFNIGTGFSEVERADIWSRRTGSRSLLGSIVKYRYQPTGVKEAPRFPVFVGWRHEDDA